MYIVLLLRIYVYYCLFAAVSRISGTARSAATTSFSRNTTTPNNNNNNNNESSNSSNSSDDNNNHVYGTARSEATTA